MRRVVVLVVGLLVLQAPVAQADPDVTVHCGGGIRTRLVLDRPDRIRLRFVLHGSAPGDRWTIWIWRAPGIMGGGHMVFHDTRMANDSGDFVMQRTFLRRRPLPFFGVTARNWQTDRQCGAGVWGPEEQAVPALAAPDVVRQGRCNDGAKSQLALTDLGRRILVRFELHQSPMGHTWRITIRHGGGIMGPNFVQAFSGIRVAGDSGAFSVQLPTPDRFHSATCGGLGCPADWFKARATDTQTGQLCRVEARIR
jgi:hypothetical protein